MAQTTGISWCDATFNPWMGCTKVSPACANCYAERDWDKRYGKVKWGDGGTRVKTSAENWKKPLLWNQAIKDGKCSGCFGKGFTKKGNGNKAENVPCNLCDATGKPTRRPRIFCASLADVFETWIGPIRDSGGSDIICRPYLESENTPEFWLSEAPDSLANDPQGWSPITMDDLRCELFRLIDATPHLDWLLLTKRPENIRRMWWGHTVTGFRPCHRENVWIGTSVENQHYADIRIPELLKCRELSPVLFLSCEPIVGEVDLTSLWASRCEYRDVLNGIHVGSSFQQSCATVDWVIAGGESGPAARPADPEWFLSLRNQCWAAGVPFHFKQWGEFDEHQNRVGKKAAGRLLDGVVHDDFPRLQTTSI